MKVSIFGNADLAFDSLPIQIMPQLQDKFSEIDFVMEDPNELDLPTEKSLVYLDTVQGLKKVRKIDAQEIAETGARATAHDFDLATHILLVKKIDKDIDIVIIGVPMDYTADQAYEEVQLVLSEMLIDTQTL